MVTWTTYGSWLQGDKRGYVKDGQIRQGNETIVQWCKKFQKGPTVRLSEQEKEIVRQAIYQEAKRIGQKLGAVAVCTNHVHLAVQCPQQPIERAVSRYKSTATRALRCHGRLGSIWTTGFDKRFCFTEADLAKRIAYVRNHKD